MALLDRVERWFEFGERQATWRGEIIGGATTFLTMAYIVFVQPAVLAQAGMDFGAVMVATCLSAAIATLIMALAANYPIALASGMGENFFFVYGVVLATGMAWTDAMSAVFYAGILFVILSLVRARETILTGIPDSLKTATAVGIGILIAFFGLTNAGVIVKGSGALVKLGDPAQPSVLLALGGLLVTIVMTVWQVRGAIFWGILLTASAAALAGLIHIEGVVAAPPSLSPTFARLSWTPLLSADYVAAVFVFLFMEVLDTIGTLSAVGKQGGFFVQGKLPRANRAFLADSLGIVSGAVLGTTTVAAYVESSAGIAAGARTGASNLVVVACFLLSLLFYPLVKAVGGGMPAPGGGVLNPITAPALILVGVMMTRLVGRIPWDDLTDAIPAFLIIVGIPLTFSISDGLALGFSFYPVVKLAAGRHREVHPVMYILAAASIARYAFL
jgi:AGZA family xanthine/uracil permease-like MFS transporter